MSSIDYWRTVFRCCTKKGNIFDVIDNAIELAAMDRPEEFLVRRGSIVEKLFTSHRLDNSTDPSRRPEDRDRNIEEEEEEEEGNRGGKGRKEEVEDDIEESKVLARDDDLPKHNAVFVLSLPAVPIGSKKTTRPSLQPKHEDPSIQAKIQRSRGKLQESYLRADNARKRRIKLLEADQLPKQSEIDTRPKRRRC